MDSLPDTPLGNLEEMTELQRLRKMEADLKAQSAEKERRTAEKAEKAEKAKKRKSIDTMPAITKSNISQSILDGFDDEPEVGDEATKNLNSAFGGFGSQFPSEPDPEIEGMNLNEENELGVALRDPDYDPNNGSANKKPKTPKTADEKEMAELNASITKIEGQINAKFLKYTEAVNSFETRQTKFKKLNQDFKLRAEKHKSQDMIDCRQMLIDMFKDGTIEKLQDIKWRYKNPNPSDEIYEMEENPDTGRMRIKRQNSTPVSKNPKEYKDAIIDTDALHEFCEFMRASADYIDPKNIKATTIEAEVKQLQSEYDAKLDEKAQKKKAKWATKFGFDFD